MFGALLARALEAFTGVGGNPRALVPDAPGGGRGGSVSHSSEVGGGSSIRTSLLGEGCTYGADPLVCMWACPSYEEGVSSNWRDATSRVSCSWVRYLWMVLLVKVYCGNLKDFYLISSLRDLTHSLQASRNFVAITARSL